MVGLVAEHSVDRFVLDFAHPENTLHKFQKLYNLALLNFVGKYHYDVTFAEYKLLLKGEFESCHVMNRM